MPGDSGDLRVRASVAKGVLNWQTSIDGRRWPTLQLAAFPVARSFLVGPMCCAPDHAGLEVMFSDFRVLAPFNRTLHDFT